MHPNDGIVRNINGLPAYCNDVNNNCLIPQCKACEYRRSSWGVPSDFDAKKNMEKWQERINKRINIAMDTLPDDVLKRLFDDCLGYYLIYCVR